MADDWDEATKQAMKILGPKGKVPNVDAITKFENGAVAKAIEAFHKSRDDLEAKMTDLETQLERSSSMIDQFEAKVEKDNLGLNDSNKEESKKIDQAKEILCGTLKEAAKNRDNGIKDLKEAARHLILLSKYKPEPITN